ncbi:transmembrane protein 59-like [Anolis sagrei]|uniref:transmembrane protein 59-like n=1 Tax=Anolis sagrei TaxID=38937 RepID=UPI003522E86F
MAAGPPVAALLLAAALAASASLSAPPEDPFAGQLGDLSACRERCVRSLRNPGAPPGESQDAVFNACYRGCRLFSICHFVDATVELNATQAECESACMEAYLGGEEQFGCLTGCRTQMPVTESLEEKAQDPKPAPFSVFDLVSNFCNDIVSSAQSFISSTWTFYLQADDGKVVVFQSQPEIEYPVPEVQAPKLEVSEEAWTPSAANTLKPHTGLREKLERPPVEEAKMQGKGQPPVDSPAPPEHDFLGCMSKRSGLPRWILAACLFLSVVVMLWLSCASLVTAPDQHIKTQPLSINGDKEFLDDLGGPVPFSLRPVIAVAICPAGGDRDGEEEAGPLPVKVDLDKTAV